MDLPWIEAALIQGTASKQEIAIPIFAPRKCTWGYHAISCAYPSCSENFVVRFTDLFAAIRDGTAGEARPDLPWMVSTLILGTTKK